MYSVSAKTVWFLNRIMRKKWLVFTAMALVLGLTVILTGYSVKASYKPTVAYVEAGTPTVQGLLTFTNRERQKAGVKPLVLDERLNRSASMKANDMAQYNYFAHASPTSGRLGIVEYIWPVIPKCHEASENLARGRHLTSQSTVSMWMRSPTHRAALLDSRYEIIGFGIKDNYIAQHFCDIL